MTSRQSSNGYFVIPKVRDILNREWDPIGGCPNDEYEAYAAKVSAMLLQNASDDAMMEYLKWAEVENMGLAPFNSDRARKAIAAVRALVPRPYLTPEEVRYADRMLARRFGLSRFRSSYQARAVALLSLLAFLAGVSLWIGLQGP